MEHLGISAYSSDDDTDELTNCNRRRMDPNKLSFASHPPVNHPSEEKELPSKKLERFKFDSDFPAVPVPASTDRSSRDILLSYLQSKKNDQFDLTSHIRSSKDFHNPYILAKISQHFSIDEVSSNYPPLMFDPKTFYTHSISALADPAAQR